MELVEYSCSQDGHEYSVYIAVFNTYLKPVSITIQRDIHILQTFTYTDAKKTIVSYTSPSLPSDLVSILISCLRRLNYPLPDAVHDISQSIETATISFQKKRTKQYKDTLVFTTATHSFRAVIKEEPYHYSVKIGGREFVGCVELFIDKPNLPFYKPPKLAQVYSEPECWFQLGRKGQIVDLLKGSFQLCQMLFGVNIFCLDDNSNVECGVTNTDQPPRKLEKPFSLAHLSIAEKGRTWYENQFHAFLRSPEKQEEYEKSLQRVQDTSIKRIDDFEAFAAINRLRKDQYDFLKPLYETSLTWSSFFGRIPKEKQCMALFSWLPDYMDTSILQFQPTKQEWCICLEPMGIWNKEEMCTRPMERTDVFIKMSPESIRQSGGNRHKSRRMQKRFVTRKQKTMLFSFSNQY